MRGTIEQLSSNSVVMKQLIKLVLKFCRFDLDKKWFVKNDTLNVKIPDKPSKQRKMFVLYVYICNIQKINYDVDFMSLNFYV